MPVIIAMVVAAIGIVVAVVFDIFLAADSVVGNTWSEILRMWGKTTPIVPWVFGGLGGHICHPAIIGKAVLGQPTSIVFLIWLTFVVALAGVIATHQGWSIPLWVPFIVSQVAGALLWPV